MLKFLSVPGELLCNPDLRSDHKLVLSYLIGLKSSDRYFYGSSQYLADLFGTSLKAIEISTNDLITLGFISKDAQGAIRLRVDNETIFDYRKSTGLQQEKQIEVAKKVSQVAQIYSLRKVAY